MPKSNAKRSTGPSSQEPTQEPPSDAELLEGLSAYPPSQHTEGVDSLLVLPGSPVSWEGDLTQSQTQQSQASELPAIATAPAATRVSVRNCKGVPPTRYAPPDTPPEVPAITANTIAVAPKTTSASTTAAPPTHPPGLTERGKIWATAKAPTRTSWGDDKYIASAVVSLPRLHDFWTSHSHIRARIQTYEGLAERSTDGLWTFYALACAFTNTILDADSSPAELADACEAIIDIVTSDITGVDDYGVKIIP
ncbi:hypothetical protein B484DRAFT_179447, partial [Ochromonadaceae sp. CCMP2298]